MDNKALLGILIGLVLVVDVITASVIFKSFNFEGSINERVIEYRDGDDWVEFDSEVFSLGSYDVGDTVSLSFRSNRPFGNILVSGSGYGDVLIDIDDDSAVVSIVVLGSHIQV